MAVVTIEQVPKKARDLYNRASDAMRKDNADYAIEMLIATLDQEPNLLEARRLLRIAEIKKALSGKSSMGGLKGMGTKSKVKSTIKKDPAKAMKLAEELMQVDPLNPGFIYTYNEAALAAEMPEAAVMTMELARDHNGRDKEYVEALGDLYVKTGNAKEAVECFTAVAQMDPNNQKVRKKMRDAAAVSTIDRGKWEKDGDYTEKLADQEASMQMEREGKNVRTASETAAMISVFLKKFEAEPQSVSHARRLAELYVEAGDFDTAIDMYDTANGLTRGGDPEIERSIVDTTILIFEHNIEHYESEEGNDPAAAADMKEQLNNYKFEIAADRVVKYPNDREFKFLYGELLFERGEYTDAIRQFQEGKKNPKYRLEAQYYLGRCFNEKGQYDMAAATLEEASSEMLIMDETKKKVLYELGEIAEKMDQKPKALEYYKEIYSVDISFRDVEQKIEEGYKDQNGAGDGTTA